MKTAEEMLKHLEKIAEMDYDVFHFTLENKDFWNLIKILGSIETRGEGCLIIYEGDK